MSSFQTVMLCLVATAVSFRAKLVAQPEQGAKRITLTKSIDSDLSDTLKQLKDRHGITIAVDHDAFAKENASIKTMAAKPVRLRKLPTDVPEALIVEIVAQQVGGLARLNKENGSYVIVPGGRWLPDVLPPPTPKLIKLVKEQVNHRLDIHSAPLRDITEFFEDRCEVTIIVDDFSFPRENGKSVKDSLCFLPAGFKPLNESLAHLAKQVGGEVILKDKVILITRKPKKSS